MGSVLGLDRIPEIKTARRKIDEMASADAAALWAKEIFSFWMELDEALAGVLYVDGHVCTYSGYQTSCHGVFLHAVVRRNLATIKGV